MTTAISSIPLRCELHERNECRSLTVAMDGGCHGKPARGRNTKLCSSHYWHLQTEAHRIVAEAVADGVLIRLATCELCGDRPPARAHHEDYSHPLDVLWLRTPCHTRVHSMHAGLPAYAAWLRAELAKAEHLLALTQARPA